MACKPEKLQHGQPAEHLPPNLKDILKRTEEL